MEAPPKGMTPENLAKAFETHINDHYIRKDENTYVCKDCDTRIENVTCYISIHSKAFSGCVGVGKVEQVPLPYCPKCEGVPKNVSTCMHQ